MDGFLARDLHISSLKARPMRKKGGEVIRTRIEVYSKVVDTGLSAQRAYPSFNSAQPIKSPRCEGERIRSSCKNIPPLRWLG